MIVGSLYGSDTVYRHHPDARAAGCPLHRPGVSAECAWVLWWDEKTTSFSYRTAEANVLGTRNYPKEEQSWGIIGTYTAKMECEQQQTSKLEGMRKSWQKAKAEAKAGEHTIDYQLGTNVISKRSHYTGEYTSTYWTNIRYLCLPDTIDPRIRKGP